MSQGKKPKPNRPPNLKLKAARKALPSPSGAPEMCMSRRELAEAANAYVWSRTRGEQHTNMTEHDIGRYERGEVHWPERWRRYGLRGALGVSSDNELGFYPNRKSAISTGGASSRLFEPAKSSSGISDSSAAKGFEFPARLEDAIQVTTNLWRADVEGRNDLRNAEFVASAFITPALRAIASGEEHPGSGGDWEVHEPDVETVRRITIAFRELDNRYGGGQIRERSLRFLDAEVAPLLKGRFNEQVGRSLVSAVAELTALTGWAAYDTGLHGLGQRYLVQALRMAVAAADRPLSAEVLAAMSHQCIYLGESAEALDLARAAGKIAREVDIPALVAEAAVLEAHGHAVANDERSCTASLTRAEAALDKADRSRDPAWIGYFDEAYLSAKFGHCFTALGRGDLAERFAYRSLEMDGTYVRGRQFNLALYATALVDQDNPRVDQAAAVGIEAALLAEGLRSARSIDYLARLADRLAPYCGVREVDDFNDCARPLLHSN